MPRAILSSNSSIFYENFSIAISFAEEIDSDDFLEENISLTTTGITTPGNGITNVSFALTGEENDWELYFELPASKKGRFNVGLTGSLASDSTDTFLGNTLTVEYNTYTPILVECSEVTGVQTAAFNVNITFSQSVTNFTAADLLVSVEGLDDYWDGISGVTSAVTGSGTDWVATVTPPAISEGSFYFSVYGTVTGSDGRGAEDVSSNRVFCAYETGFSGGLGAIGQSPPALSVSAVVGSSAVTQSGDFSLTVTFTEPVSGFTSSNVSISITGVSTPGNGITNVYTEVTGSDDTYNIRFTLPQDKIGSFNVTLTGNVTQLSDDSDRTISSNTQLVKYNNVSSISVGFGTIFYGADGLIKIPITFPEDVIYFSKTDCELTQIYGSDIYDFNYYLVGSGTDYELVIEPSSDRVGMFSVDITGYAFKVSTQTYDDVTVTPVYVPYNSRTPEIVSYDSPTELSPGIFDVVWELDHPDVGFDNDDLIYEGDIEGVDFETNPPLIYRATNLDVLPELPANPADFSNPPDEVGSWSRHRPGVNPVPARFILIRFNVPVGASGQMLVRPKPDGFRRVFL